MSQTQEENLTSTPEWLALVRPRYQAAALVFAALRALGEYPEDAPDYDATVVALLRSALAQLAPGFGNLDTLGAPHPRQREPAVADPPRSPDWLLEVLSIEGR